MHYKLAIKIEKVHMPHGETARRRAWAPVDSLVSKALMSRMELRSRMRKTDAVQHRKYFYRGRFENCMSHMNLGSLASYGC
jgi:hypothetical protein